MAVILFFAVPKMKVSYLINVLVGGVCYINYLPVGEVGKKVSIGLPPVLCFGGLIGWHGADIWREESIEFSCVCGTYVKMVKK